MQHVIIHAFGPVTMQWLEQSVLSSTSGKYTLDKEKFRKEKSISGTDSRNIRVFTLPIVATNSVKEEDTDESIYTGKPSD